MINAGDLTRRITIQSKTVTQDTDGAEIVVYSTLATVWAQVITNSGREFYAAQKINAETTAVFRIRYRTGIETTSRVQYGNRYFDILHINDVDERHEEITLLCREVV